VIVSRDEAAQPNFTSSNQAAVLNNASYSLVGGSENMGLMPLLGLKRCITAVTFPLKAAPFDQSTKPGGVGTEIVREPVGPILILAAD